MADYETANEILEGLSRMSDVDLEIKKAIIDGKIVLDD